MVSLGSNMKRLLPLLVFVLACIQAAGQVIEGDLAFVVNRQGNAITQVTQGIDGMAIDHVAILHRVGGDCGPLYAIEALPRHGVCLTPIDTFVCRNGAENIVVGRVEQLDAQSSVRNALQYVGLPYDYYFIADNDEIYCSELVQLSFIDKRGNKVFNTIPMSFHDENGCIPDYWIRHYAARSLDVPQGTPGTNPGQLSRDDKVTIINHVFNR